MIPMLLPCRVPSPNLVSTRHALGLTPFRFAYVQRLGGSGQVYLCEDVEGGKRVAKVLPMRPGQYPSELHKELWRKELAPQLLALEGYEGGFSLAETEYLDAGEGWVVVSGCLLVWLERNWTFGMQTAAWLGAGGPGGCMCVTCDLGVLLLQGLGVGVGMGLRSWVGYRLDHQLREG